MTQENTIDINIEFTFAKEKHYTYFAYRFYNIEDEITRILDFIDSFDIYSSVNSQSSRAIGLCESIQSEIVNRINDSALMRNEQPLLDQDLFRDADGDFSEIAYCKYFNKNLTKVHAYIDGGKKHDVTNNIKMQYNEN